MNGSIVVDIVFVAVAIGVIFSCGKNGFIGSIIHFFKTLIASIIAYTFGGKLANFLCERYVSTPVHNFVYDKINGLYSGATETLNAEAVIEAMPDIMVTQEVRERLAAAESSGQDLVNSMTDSIATPFSSAISGLIGYMCVFLAALIILSILAFFITKLVENVKGLKKMNTFLGVVLGTLISVIVLSVAATAIKLFAGETEFYTNSILLKFFGDSALLDYLKFLDITKLIFR